MRYEYETVTVIVDGALGEEWEFFDYALRDEFVARVKEDSRGDGYSTQIYILGHFHAPDEECECIQYATSHKPYWDSDVDE